ncbi:unnamed protein product, partial [Medioppia subpectinata]
VVKACVETATNHLDISGEPQYMESMQLKYNKAAQEKGIYIASACGWDSIPCDLGVQFLKKHFNGELNSVETFLTVKTGPNGLTTNYGTWQSAIHGFAAGHELGALRRQLYREVFTKRRPQTKFRLPRKSMPFRSEYLRGWSVPFPGCDRSVVQRTQQYRYEKLNERPTQIETYFTVGSFLSLVGLAIMGIMFGLMASFRWGRSLLEAYPAFFSFGAFTKTGPTREQIMAATFRTLIVGKGWSEKLSEPTDEPNEAPNKTVIVKDRPKLGPIARGGVFTPGALFDGTGIFDRLKAHDLNIEVVNDESMPKFKTCSFSGCLTNARDNPGVSFFRYPTKDPQRCLEWVRASNNDVISGQYLSGGHISDNETVCELHFSLEDITVYSSRKLLATNAVPIDEVRTAVPLQANTTADTNYGHSYKSGKTFASHKVNKKSFAQKTIRKYNKSFAKPKLAVLLAPTSIYIGYTTNSSTSRRTGPQKAWKDWHRFGVERIAIRPLYHRVSYRAPVLTALGCYQWAPALRVDRRRRRSRSRTRMLWFPFPLRFRCDTYESPDPSTGASLAVRSHPISVCRHHSVRDP